MGKNKPPEEISPPVITDESIRATHHFLTGRLGLSARFINGILETDDEWTLVIKLHAMVESALNEVLMARFKVPELEKVIARLETGDPERGKIAFAQKFGWITDRQRTFLRFFSTLRNFLVHDAKNFEFSLKTYPDTLVAGERSKWISLLTDALSENLRFEGVSVTRTEFAEKDPRNALCNACLMIMHKLTAALDSLLIPSPSGAESTPKGQPDRQTQLPPMLPMLQSPL